MKSYILKKTYFKELYSNKNESYTETIDTNFFPENTNNPKLNEEDKSSCEGELTQEECCLAIKKFNNNKSPGTDGLPIEFYKIFWQDLKEIILKAFNFTFTSQEMSTSQKQGIITLIPKKKKRTLDT